MYQNSNYHNLQAEKHKPCIQHDKTRRIVLRLNTTNVTSEQTKHDIIQQTFPLQKNVHPKCLKSWKSLDHEHTKGFMQKNHKNQHTHIMYLALGVLQHFRGKNQHCFAPGFLTCNLKIFIINAKIQQDVVHNFLLNNCSQVSFTEILTLTLHLFWSTDAHRWVPG